MSISNVTPYELLGMQPTDDDSVIRYRFRKRIIEFKQDRLTPAEKRTITAEKFRLICRAYETLCVPDKRKRYDQTKQWIWNIPIENYTLQQLVAEPDLVSELERRLHNATLRQINYQDPASGHTPLYCAARACNMKAVSYLTEHGAEPDLKQGFGSTALHVAAYYGHPEVVQCLLESGADYLQQNAGNKTAEEESLNDDVRKCFEELKQNLYVKAAANQLDWFKNNVAHISQHIDYQYYALRQTLLHCASKKGHKHLVEWLVKERKANLDIIDVNLNSALHLAAFGGHRSIVKYLLNYGANSLLINEWGMTAEQEGSFNGEAIQKLFQAMRDLDMFKMASDGIDWWFEYYFGKNSPDAINNTGVSLLYVACRYGQTSVAKWLLDHGAQVNLQLQDDTKSTPLHSAAYHGHVLTVELLLTHGANVNIRNKYSATVFDDARSEEVKNLLRQYRQNLKENRLISVHLFSDGASSGNKPLAKVKLSCDATFDELIKSIPAELRNTYQNFSMARRPLNHENNNISVISAVCRARCGKTKFIELPLCITAHESPRYTRSGHTMSPEPTFYSLREFHSRFNSKCQTSTLIIKSKNPEPQTFPLDSLSFTFPPECVQHKLTINLSYVIGPDVQTFGLPQCLCIFKTQCDQQDNGLHEMPTVSFTGEPNSRLYTWTKSLPYWFTLNKKDTHLPLIGGIHAFVRHVDIIPPSLSLPGDMFLQGALGKPLKSRQQPVVCQCLQVREHNASDFPYIAYHGTKIDVVSSILMDGLVMPSTVVSGGIRVCPPAGHIARGVKNFGIEDFANAIFVSPSIHYCSDSCYAVTFSYGDECIFPVLELSVKRDPFDDAYPCTVPGYVAHPGDDLNAIEWRLDNPANIEILSVLFISQIKSKTEAARSRAKKLGVDPNVIA